MLKSKSNFLSAGPSLFFLWIFCILLTRLPSLYHDFTQVDEVLFALGTKIWLKGGIPYIDFVETKALGIYYFYAFASLLSGKSGQVSLLSIHLLTLVCVFLTTFFIYQIALKLYSEKAAFYSSLFFIFFSTNFLPNIIAANMEVILLLPYTISVFLILKHAKAVRLKHCFFSGIFFSAALLIKQQAGMLLPLQLIYFLFLLPRPQLWTLRKGLLASLVFLIGCVPLPLLMLLHLQKLGSLNAFFFWVVSESLNYVWRGDLAIDGWAKFFSRGLPFILATALPWILCGQRLIYFLRNRNFIPLHSKLQENYLWIWFFLSFFPIAAGHRFFDHYFLIIFPPLSLLAGLAVDQWAPEQWRRYKIAFFIAFFLPSLGFTLLRYNMHSMYAYTQKEDLETYRPYGEQLKKLTREDDRVFVWGYAPSIYWYSGRLPATRFLWSDLLSGRVPGMNVNKFSTEEIAKFKMPESWNMLWEDFEKHPPQIIMDTGTAGFHDYQKIPMSVYPQLWEYVQKNYEELESFQGARVFRRKNL
ncbi:MAG: glycosyltransferase family 39 protein [Deltaproteobacteria bacterium]|nr:glycosyltransferase family 39 protein [Deltaproteobacteria bacterium]